MLEAKANVKAGRIFGIPVGLHWSFFIIFLLVTLSLATGYFPLLLSGHSRVYYWALGLITSLLFFFSVLAHEIGHAWVALRHRIPVQSITLLVFGGVAQIGEEPRTPREELTIAIAGPSASLLCGLLFESIFLVMRSAPEVAASAEWLARVNLALVIFNMIPGYPLDGSRVLRAILWKLTHNQMRATRFAGYSSQVVALGFVGIGIFSAVGGHFINAIWLVIIGWFVQNAAASFSQQTQLQRTLGHTRVANIMTQNYVLTPRYNTIDRLIEEMTFGDGSISFFVMENGKPVGMFTIHELAHVAPAQWTETTAGQLMTPLENSALIQPETTLLAAMYAMDDSHVHQVPVIQDGNIAGLVSRDQVLRYLRSQSEIDS